MAISSSQANRGGQNSSGIC